MVRTSVNIMCTGIPKGWIKDESEFVRFTMAHSELHPHLLMISENVIVTDNKGPNLMKSRYLPSTTYEINNAEAIIHNIHRYDTVELTIYYR